MVPISSAQFSTRFAKLESVYLGMTVASKEAMHRTEDIPLTTTAALSKVLDGTAPLLPFFLLLYSPRPPQRLRADVYTLLRNRIA